MSAAPDAASTGGVIRAVVVVVDEHGAEAAGAPYEMFDVESIDVGGARLVAPLLLEIGEEITLRVERGAARAEVRARVAAVERGEREAVSIVEFIEVVGEDDDAIRAVINA